MFCDISDVDEYIVVSCVRVLYKVEKEKNSKIYNVDKLYIILFNAIKF